MRRGQRPGLDFCRRRDAGGGGHRRGRHRKDRSPGQLEDAKAAIRYIRANAKRF